MSYTMYEGEMTKLIRDGFGRVMYISADAIQAFVGTFDKNIANGRGAYFNDLYLKNQGVYDNERDFWNQKPGIIDR